MEQLAAGQGQQPSAAEFVLRLDGPEDVENLQQIREYVTMKEAEHRAKTARMAENANLIDANLKLCLCVADLNRTRREELEKETQRMREETAGKNATIQQLQKDNSHLRHRLRTWESREENDQHWVERQQQLNSEKMAALATSKRTMKRMAEIVEEPPMVHHHHQHHRRHHPPSAKPPATAAKPNKVGCLRKRFDPIPGDAEEGREGGDQQEKATTSSARRKPAPPPPPPSRR